ncbi:hypothetical protein [Desulfoferula mesophila]|uniref:hypothetical protein n=1 Tax=Desulfoferula mesophila TaxID=3058419 RepID=UPI0030D4DFBC
MVLIYAVAVGLRVWRFFSGELHDDSAVVGLMGLAVLQGPFPIFFFGQNWMGSLDAILAAPLYAWFGPSALTVNVLPPVLSLAFMACLQPILRRRVGTWGMLAGLAYLAVPPTSWLYWCGEARTHYMLGLLLAALVLLMTHRLWQERAWSWSNLLLWGLFGGAALWTNFSVIVVILPCTVFLLFTCKGKISLWSVPLAALGGVVGGAPLLWFNLTHHMANAGQGGFFGWQYILPALSPLLNNSLPMILGLNTAISGGPTGGYGIFLLLYGLLLAVVGLGGYFLFRLNRGQGQAFTWLLLGIALLNLVVVISSAYIRGLYEADPRYLLCLYLVVPFLVGALARWLSTKNSWAAVALVLALALVHVSQYSQCRMWNFQSPLLDIKHGFYLNQEAGIKKNLREIRAAGFKYLYSKHRWYILNFLANGDPVVCNYWKSRDFNSTIKVDASDNPGMLDMDQGSLDILGLAHKTWRGGRNTIVYDFSAPTGAAVLLPRRSWSARANGRDLGQTLNDADLTTGFSTPGPAREGDSLTIDLGRPQNVGGLAMIPAEFRQVPKGLMVELAGPDGVFSTVRQSRTYWGPFYLSGPHPFLKARYPRVESYFPPRQTRYIRLTHQGENRYHHWSVHELLLFGPGPESECTWDESARRVFRILKADNIQNAYGDAWIAAKVVSHFQGNVHVVTGNVNLDVYGTGKRTYSKPLILRPVKGSALILNQRAGAIVETQLASYGISYRRQDAGRFVVFLLDGQAQGEPLAIKRLPTPQGQGVVWQIGQGPSAELGWLRLSGLNDRLPPDFSLECRTSQGAWEPVDLVKAGPIVFSGQVLLGYQGKDNLYRLATPHRAKQIRLRQLSPQAAQKLGEFNLSAWEPTKPSGETAQ